MKNPKVSILIPMYNQMNYIVQCVDSALNQNFRDEYEIVIRDNCSTDDTYEFVHKKYAEQIKLGKIRLYRNNKNLYLLGNSKLLIEDAKGKYILFLHNDDMLLEHAVAHLYEVAEKTNADVVHESYFFNSSPSGIIKDLSDCKVTCHENNTFDKVTIMPEDSLSRFKEWFNGGTFWDAQYNFFNKEFIIKHRIFMDEAEPGRDGHDYYYSSLWWLMLAKVFVKTPICCYIRRDHSGSGTRSNYSPELLTGLIRDTFIVCKDFDKLFDKVDFLKNNEHLHYIIKSHYIALIDYYQIRNREIYKNGLTPELYEIALKFFKEHFGENYFYPMLMFNWAHLMPFGKAVDTINFQTNDTVNFNSSDPQS